MRVFTRGDMDGLTSIVLLSLVEDISEIAFAHPRPMQDGSIEVNKNDIILNLPYVPGCGMWFNHHISEEIKLKDIGKFKGSFAIAPALPGSFSIFTKARSSPNIKIYWKLPTAWTAAVSLWKMLPTLPVGFYSV